MAQVVHWDTNGYVVKIGDLPIGPTFDKLTARAVADEMNLALKPLLDAAEKMEMALEELLHHGVVVDGETFNADPEKAKEALAAYQSAKGKP